MIGYRPRPAPELSPDAHKGSAGRVLAIAGSALMPGAAVLVARAAQRAGAGLVTLGAFTEELPGIVAASSPETIYLDLSHSRPEALLRVVEEHRHDVRAIGPGLGTGEIVRALVERVSRSGFEGPLVLDADALNVLGTNLDVLFDYRGPLVLTPHPGEAARLTGGPAPEGFDARVECASAIQRKTRGICVLKGHETLVVDEKNRYLNQTGNVGMATAGAGDVLFGILAAYLAASVSSGGAFSAFDAAAAAVYVHGLAGDLAARELGQRALVASDLIDYLGAAQQRFVASRGSAGS